jgi:hypothetical protein
MIEVTTKAYTFEELSAEAQQVALDNNREFNVSDYFIWYDWIEENFKDDLSKSGFDNVEIAFSGFWSQGDGASFTADTIDLHALNKVYNLGIKKVVCDIINKECFPKVRRSNRHYSHEHTCSIDYDGVGYSRKLPRLEAVIDKVMDQLEGIRLTLCRELYKALEGEFTNLQSDNVIKEALVDCECLFTEDGQNHRYA